jgi:peptidoglycan/xylan/chitin deacetylase (PgdA/CDA1 family)
MVSIAREILAPRGIGAIVFAVTGMSSETNEWDQAHGATRIELLDTKQLAELATMGVEIASHSRTHRELPLLAVDEQAQEIVGSAADLKQATGIRPRFFAYPYGAFDAATPNAVSEGGFLAAFVLAYRHASQASNRFKLPRVIILSDDDGWRFRLKTSVPQLFGRLLQLWALPHRAVRFARRLHGG